MDIEKRFEILIKLVEALHHGKCTVYFQDKNIVKIEKIETNAEIKK